MRSRRIEVRHRVATFVGAVLWCTALAVTLPDGRAVSWLAVYSVLIAGMIGAERMHVRPHRRYEQRLAAALRRERRRTARRRSVPHAARQAVLIDHRPFAMGRRRPM